jgi:hypothetical protein
MSYPINSRFAVCACGNGFSVEDRKTGERVSFHTNYNKALKARNAAVTSLILNGERQG